MRPIVSGQSAITSSDELVENDGCNSCVVSVELPKVRFLRVQTTHAPRLVRTPVTGRVLEGCFCAMPAWRRTADSRELAGGRRLREAEEPCSPLAVILDRSEPAMINRDVPEPRGLGSRCLSRRHPREHHQGPQERFTRHILLKITGDPAAVGRWIARFAAEHVTSAQASRRQRDAWRPWWTGARTASRDLTGPIIEAQLVGRTVYGWRE
jgi:hypothetical protein